MKAALRPALPLLIGIALAGVLALVAMHSLAFGLSTATLGSHHSVGYVLVSGHSQGAADAELETLAVLDGGSAHGVHDLAAHDQAAHDHGTHDQAAHAHATYALAAHGHGASAACTSPGEAECCSAVANAVGAPTFALHAIPGATVSALAASMPVPSLLATEAAERPPSRVLLSVLRV